MEFIFVGFAKMTCRIPKDEASFVVFLHAHIMCRKGQISAS